MACRFAWSTLIYAVSITVEVLNWTPHEPKKYLFLFLELVFVPIKLFMIISINIIVCLIINHLTFKKGSGSGSLTDRKSA